MNDDATPRRAHPLVRGFLIALCLFAVAFPLLILVALLPRATLEALLHFIAGWAFFLHRNLPAVIRDPAVLLSGAVATVLALILTHFLARRLLAHRWKWSASFATIGFLFTGFAAAFLVPGIILILRTPMHAPWTESSGASSRAIMALDTRHLCQALAAYVQIEHRDHYPDSLARVVTPAGFIEPDSPLARADQMGFLYPGAGLPVDLEKRCALVISPQFLHRGDLVRMVGWSDGSYESRTIQEIEALLAETETLSPRIREEAGR